ncbi:hypothetical protein H2198_005927 [Neophaeococcomyces mojaviensis]|uniref:Uncharacterized protein n=1 Tax=Neophaeococcomyces mojaviensis TaxID=3383035 RepID=A0ACC3A4B4_9EURO|nr:hypothetical protein H2198_005927 [Knufia sp. JES_112]
MADYSNLPDFDSLPKVEGMPQGCAWGLFDKNGKKDHLGCINLLTPSVVKEALKEATDGTSVSLNWAIGAIETPGFQRKGLVHKVLSFKEGPFGLHGFDDEVEFNTQCSSQWDSLVHYAHQPTGKAYNGCQTTKEELEQPFGKMDLNQGLPTLNHWHQRGGLVARGVLIDYRAWAEHKGVKYDCFSDHRIKTSELEEVAKWEGVEFRQGDILIVRTGFTEELGSMNAEQQAKALGTHKTVGVEGTAESAKWHWNHHFASVAGDAIAYEALPPLKEDGNVAGIDELVLHQYFLSLFGMNIGELWDLQALSKACKEKGKYTFLMTSCPLNVPGSVGSPPNALAIF